MKLAHYMAYVSKETLPIQSSGLLTPGMKYRILSYEEGDDFLNVGSEYNQSTVLFQASDTTPAVWTNGSILLPCPAPDLDVFDSDLFYVPSFVYHDVGRFMMTLPKTDFRNVFIPTPCINDLTESDYAANIFNMGDDGYGNTNLMLQFCGLQFSETGKTATETDDFGIQKLPFEFYLRK